MPMYDTSSLVAAGLPLTNKWINVPFGLTQDIIERVLFYSGKGVFYFNDKVEKFQFLPFALKGGD